MHTYTLFSSKGCGSAAVETTLAILDLPYEVIDATPWENTPASRRLQELNPLKQVPCLCLPDGRIMTESAAILLYLASLRGGVLSPATHSPREADLWRWMVFLSTNVYRHITLGDHPEQWVEGEEAQKAFKAKCDEKTKAMWQVMENAMPQPSPYLLGERLSILDIYTATISYWRPGRAWFEAHCPKLTAAVQQTETHPVVKKIFVEQGFLEPLA